MVLTGMKLGPEALVKKYGEARARRVGTDDDGSELTMTGRN